MEHFCNIINVLLSRLINASWLNVFFQENRKINADLNVYSNVFIYSVYA